MKPLVVASVVARDAAHGSELGAAPAACGLVELRADRLRSEAIVAAVREAGRPCIVTVRRVEHGGFFDGSEEERRRALLLALEAGAAFIDVEWNGPLADLAHGTTAPRVILSHHAGTASDGDLAAIHEAMAATPAARLKIVPRASNVGAAVAQVRRLLGDAGRGPRPLACFAAGRAGAITRLLAPSWGSWATYGSVSVGCESAPGQFPVVEMLDLYDVLRIGPATRRFALVGSAVFDSPTPAMHAVAARELAVDARCFPIESDDLDEVLPLIGAQGAAGIEALAVTIPFKEVAAARCQAGDDVARRAGAVNTVTVAADGWTGFNTDGTAMLDLVCSRLAPRGARVAIVGAGGTARAAVAVFALAGAEVTVYNRTRERAEAVAATYHVRAGSLSDLETAAWDVLVQATPLGRTGERFLRAERLCGRIVLDAAYGPVPTPLVRDARSLGLTTFDGLDLLVAQGVLQVARILGRSPRESSLRRAAAAFMARRRGC